MRIVFMGTPEFAAVSLRALLGSHHTVAGVVSQPDRPAGRGNAMKPPEVAVVAREHGLPLIQPEAVRTREFRAWLRAREPEIGVVAAFGHVLGPKVLGLPPRGCLNVHASLLPRWRGAAPIQAALLAGDPESGVCIMRMEPGLDTGPVLHRLATPITDQDTAETLHDRLAALGARALLEALDRLEAGPVPAEAQPAEGVTWASPLRRDDADLDFTQPAEALARRVRGLHPWPGTRARLGGQSVKVFPPVAALPPDEATAGASPGTVVAAGPDGVDVATGDGGRLRLMRLQAPGRKPLDAGPFLAGHPLPPGTRFDP